MFDVSIWKQEHQDLVERLWNAPFIHDVSEGGQPDILGFEWNPDSHGIWVEENLRTSKLLEKFEFVLHEQNVKLQCKIYWHKTLNFYIVVCQSLMKLSFVWCVMDDLNSRNEFHGLQRQWKLEEPYSTVITIAEMLYKEIQ